MGKTTPQPPEDTKPEEIEDKVTTPVDTDLTEAEKAQAEATPDAEPYEELETEAEEQEAELNPEAKRVLEANYPVLREHGSHNAAVNGLQTSPGYDPTKR